MKQKLAGSLIVAAALLISASILYSSPKNQTANLAQIGTAMNNPQSIVSQVESGQASLIDVRTDAEWNAAHATPAMHFDLARLQAGELPSLSKDAVIYVYCRTGVRAGEAKTILEQNGYTNVTDIGGLSNWQAMGGAVEQ